MPTNDHDLNQPHRKKYTRSSETPGYETTDVNVGGVVVFLSGLMGFLVVFFVFCYVMGKVINGQLQATDGRADKWHQSSANTGGKREDLASNPEMEQKELNRLTTTFPEPRLDIDDGNQATADLHAREDLLLDHYSVSPAEGQAIRIPIERAMELIAQRGLAIAPPIASTAQMVGDARPEVQAPLTTGFARTGYELDTIEARKQQLDFGKAESAAHAELAPVK